MPVSCSRRSAPGEPARPRSRALPAYVIFHDATLREVAVRRPGSLEDLGTITGVGESKLAKYGEQLLAALAAHSLA